MGGMTPSNHAAKEDNRWLEEDVRCTRTFCLTFVISPPMVEATLRYPSYVKPRLGTTKAIAEGVTVIADGANAHLKGFDDDDEVHVRAPPRFAP